VIPPRGSRPRRAARRSRREAEADPTRSRATEGLSAEAIAALGPYARGRLVVRIGELALPLDVPFDVFASHAIDDGTLLLLRNLPSGPCSSFLDLGCGYGALGLPVAARFPQARAILVDRDVLAVRASAHNAAALGLANVEARPGIGYRNLSPGERFDWILCNVPARIGERAIGHFLAGGSARLTAAGELRVVVIRDLCETVEAQARRLELSGLRRVASARRHAVYSLPPGTSRDDVEEPYARDEIAIEPVPGRKLRLERPQDASEDPDHRRRLSLLFEALPRAPPRRALSYRCGYGAVPLALRARYPGARVVAQDRDLLALAFAERNATALGLGGDELRLAACVFPSEAASAAEADLVVGESSAPAGPGVFARELREARDLCAPGGEAVILVTDKQAREWLPRAREGSSAAILARREGACLVRISRPRGGRPGSGP
jgi:16S rRNA (guanine1207-N2)-methyltransferase